jgi:hypothetical protein
MFIRNVSGQNGVTTHTVLKPPPTNTGAIDSRSVSVKGQFESCGNHSNCRSFKLACYRTSQSALRSLLDFLRRLSSNTGFL